MTAGGTRHPSVVRSLGSSTVGALATVADGATLTGSSLGTLNSTSDMSRPTPTLSARLARRNPGSYHGPGATALDVGTEGCPRFGSPHQERRHTQLIRTARVTRQGERTTMRSSVISRTE